MARDVSHRISYKRWFSFLLGSALVLLSATASAEGLDPRLFYFLGGQVVGERGFSVGDPENWSVPMVDGQAKSKSGKMTVTQVDFRSKGDALLVQTSKKKVIAQLGLYGKEVNLAETKDIAALVMSVNVERKPNADVKVAMDCGYPCRGEVSIGKVLRENAGNGWFSLPIPLNCFDGKTFDLSKINGVFVMQTTARMKIQIADLRIEKLADGEKGCVESQ